MKYTIIIDGGIGRVVCSIPALEKFVTKNPDTLILCNGWNLLLWGNPLLQDRVFDSNNKNLFNLIKDTKILHPEPYYNQKYINGQIHLIQAFDEELNGTIELNRPTIHLTPLEYNVGRKHILQYGDKNKRTIAFQPFGSTAVLQGDAVVDETNRSLNLEQTMFMLEQLTKEYNVFLMIHENLRPLIHSVPCIIIDTTQPLREWVSVVNASNFFVGVDSCCQHFAFSLNKPGVVFMGGTTTTNCSYEKYFTVIEKDVGSKPYTPYRICEFDAYLSNLSKKDCMSFTKDELQEVVNLINQQLKG